jgi:Family of unknown function (DUF6503)
MKKYLFLLLVLQATFTTAQVEEHLTGSELLKRCIAYHDPKGNWEKFRQRLILNSVNPNRTATTIFDIDMVKGDFNMVKTADGKHIEASVIKGKTYTSSIDGNTQISEEDRKKYRLSNEYIKNTRSYYTYLYGLPMKLKDFGTKVNEEVKKDTFNDKTYWVLKVDYVVEVGTDTWFFYINPNNYALEGYRFFHNKQPNDGEYIVLKNTIEMQGIKIPSVRTWYMNKDNKYLGTDSIEGSEGLKKL